MISVFQFKEEDCSDQERCQFCHCDSTPDTIQSEEKWQYHDRCHLKHHRTQERDARRNNAVIQSSKEGRTIDIELMLKLNPKWKE